MADYVDDYSPQCECVKCGWQGDEDGLDEDVFWSSFEGFYNLSVCPECESSNIIYFNKPESI